MLEDQPNESVTGEGTEESPSTGATGPAAASSAPRVTTSTRRRRTTTPKVTPSAPVEQDPPALPDAAVEDEDAEATAAPADSSIPPDEPAEPAAPAVTTTTRTARRRPARKAAAPAPSTATDDTAAPDAASAVDDEAAPDAPSTATTTESSTDTAGESSTRTTTRTRSRGGSGRRTGGGTSGGVSTETAPVVSASADEVAPAGTVTAEAAEAGEAAEAPTATTTTSTTSRTTRSRRGRGASSSTGVVFRAPDSSQATSARAAGAVEATDDGTTDADESTVAAGGEAPAHTPDEAPSPEPTVTDPEDGEGAEGVDTNESEDSDDDKPARRRRRRGGRRRRRGRGGDGGSDENGDDDQAGDDAGDRTGQAAETSDDAPAPAQRSKQAKRPEKGDAPESADGGEGSGGSRGSKGSKGSTGPEDSDGSGDAKDSKDSKDSKSSKGSGDAKDTDAQESSDDDGGDEQGSGSGSRRRRRRRRSGDSGGGGGSRGGDDPENTVTRVRKGRSPEDEITSLQGSTRLEAKKQRRREGREAGRRKAPIVSEAEFLARREAVDRTMVVRQGEDLTQIAVLEDKVLVEHYVARKSQTSMIGNVYLGKVQNVLPSMEAAFIDIGKGRNAVLYAGEVNWRAVGAKEGQPRKIEQVLKSGQTVLVQVSKDPIGQKGARLTGQVSLPGRFLVYVPDGTTSGISRKLPDTERSRLKTLLKQIVPSSAGVIVRTAAEGASEDELTRDVERLKAQWESIEKKVAKGNAPQMLYGEPDLTLKVVRDVFTEDFAKLVVSGDEAWGLVHDYVSTMAPDLLDRVEHHTDDKDVFGAHRIDEQIAKALDNKVWLPSGGSLIIDRTEAMTVVDVNTGKFTGSGGNLEETVTKNNLEAAEELVRQLRLRDIGGIIVVDFIDMVLENNRDLVLRRLIECLGRDRTRHQVAEVTSLGLVQMTRKRIGTGLLDSFSETCPHCKGRGHTVSAEPVEPAADGGDDRRGRGRGGKGRGSQQADNGSQGNGSGKNGGGAEEPSKPRQGPPPALLAAMAGHDKKAEGAPVGDGATEPVEAVTPADTVEPGDAAGFGEVPAVDPVTEQGTEPASPSAEPEPSVDTVAPEQGSTAPATGRGRSSSSRRTGARKAAAAPPAAAAPAGDGTPTVAAGAASASATADGAAAPAATTTTTRTTRRRSSRTATTGQADATAPSVAPHETAATGDPDVAPPAEQPDRDGDPGATD